MTLLPLDDEARELEALALAAAEPLELALTALELAMTALELALTALELLARLLETELTEPAGTVAALGWLVTTVGCVVTGLG